MEKGVDDRVNAARRRGVAGSRTIAQPHQYESRSRHTGCAQCTVAACQFFRFLFWGNRFFFSCLSANPVSHHRGGKFEFCRTTVGHVAYGPTQRSRDEDVKRQRRADERKHNTNLPRTANRIAVAESFESGEFDIAAYVPLNLFRLDGCSRVESARYAFRFGFGHIAAGRA